MLRNTGNGFVVYPANEDRGHWTASPTGTPATTYAPATSAVWKVPVTTGRASSLK